MAGKFMNTNALPLRLLTAVGVCLIVSACTDPQVAKMRHVAKGDAYMTEGKYSSAVVEYRNALKIDPKLGEARYKLAKAYDRTDRKSDAVKEYLRAADLMPDRADVQLDAAQLRLNAGDFETARTHAQTALKADPKSVDAQLALAYALAGLKDTPAAIRELEQAMQIGPEDSRPYASLGTLEATRGNPAAAE